MDDWQLAGFVELVQVGASSRGAALALDALTVGQALVAALAVDTAHQTFGAVRAAPAQPLLLQLAHLVRASGRDAARARLAITGRLALGVAGLERAHERLAAVAVDEARLREPREGELLVDVRITTYLPEEAAEPRGEREPEADLLRTSSEHGDRAS